MTSRDTRRGFLKTSVGSAVAAGLSTRMVSAQEEVPELEWRNRTDLMRYRQLGRTGFMVSEIVMGGNEITPDNYEHVLMALDRGLNYLDTSPAYGKGQSELGYAKVIQARPRDQFFLTSKVSVWDTTRHERFQKIFDGLNKDEQNRLKEQAAQLIESRGAANPAYLGGYFGGQTRELNRAALCDAMEDRYGGLIDREQSYRQSVMDSVEGSLQRLGTDHIDILMCPHGASSPVELTRYPEIFEAFDRLKQAGKVRFLGVSSHNDPAGILNAAIAAGRYSVAMVAYNIVNHAFMSDAVAAAHRAGIGVIAMKVARPVFPGPNRGAGNEDGRNHLAKLVAGDWSVPQQAYLWALRNKNLSAVISNMVNSDQVQDNIALPLADTDRS